MRHRLDARKRVVPQKRSIRDRWFLPAKTPFCGIPIPILTALNGCGAEEHRVALWLIADWYWPAGLTRSVNIARLADRAEMSRQNAARALASLAKKNFIGLTPGGKGRASLVSIEPLIQVGRKVASGEASGRCSGPHSAAEKHQVDAPETRPDAPRSIKPGLSQAPSESFPSDSSRPPSEVGRTNFLASTANGHGHDKAAEEMRREQIKAQVEAWQREGRL